MLSPGKFEGCVSPFHPIRVVHVHLEDDPVALVVGPIVGHLACTEALSGASIVLDGVDERVVEHCSIEVVKLIAQLFAVHEYHYVGLMQTRCIHGCNTSDWLLSDLPLTSHLSVLPPANFLADLHVRALRRDPDSYCAQIQVRPPNSNYNM